MIRQEQMEIRQGQMDAKLDRVYEHTAQLTEEVAGLKTRQEMMENKLDALSEDVKYLKYKEAQNEEDLFKVKSYLKMTK